MKLIVGLGNPGEKYKKTRHNIGFEVVDLIKESKHFPDFSYDKKFNGLVSKKGAFLLKPQTFMNRSGQSVKAISSYYNISPKKTIVIHDDADIPLGKVKVDKSRSSGGHKGVQSVIDHLSTKDFWRIRFGIGKDPSEKAGNIALKKFSKKERKIVENLKEKLTEEIDNFLGDELKRKSIKEKS